MRGNMETRGTWEIRRAFAIVALVATVGCYGKCAAEGGSGPSPIPATPTPTATPTMTPTPTPVARNCGISNLQWDKAPALVTKDTVFEFSPMQQVTVDGVIKTVKVPDDCNTGPRMFGIRWSVSSTVTARITPELNAYAALVDRLSTGTFTVRVELEGHHLERVVTH